MQPLPASQLVDPSWAEVIRPLDEHIAGIGNWLRDQQAQGHRYAPAGHNVLRALTQPKQDIRVLILGQDPYPTPGHAVGLSFSVAPEVTPLPRSLNNIFRELHEDVGAPIPHTGDLTPWTQRGVMLLNRVLTVEQGKPGSHRGKGWEQVTSAVISALASRPEPLVAILWGRDAQTASALLGDTPQIKSAHPSPLSASRGFFGSRPFSRANEYLISADATPIDWRLA